MCIKVAFADDHDMVRNGISTLLTTVDKSIEVIIQARNGIDMIEQLERGKNIPDVCLIDINMPEMNGYDLLINIRSKWKSIRTIILTMHTEEQAILKMLRDGANGYVSKDTPIRELIQAIKSVHNMGYYHNEHTSNKTVQSLIDLNVKITDKEKEFLTHICKELTYSQIGDEMKVSVRTVEGYRDGLFKKLNMNSRTGLVVFAMRMGLFKS